MENNYYLVMYDITDSPTLQKIGRLMIKAGMERINYSVWVGWVNPADNPKVKKELMQLINSPAAKGSLFYILPVSRTTMKKMRCINGRKPKNLDYWVGEKQLLVI